MALKSYIAKEKVIINSTTEFDLVYMGETTTLRAGQYSLKFPVDDRSLFYVTDTVDVYFPSFFLSDESSRSSELFIHYNIDETQIVTAGSNDRIVFDTPVDTQTDPLSEFNTTYGILECTYTRKALINVGVYFWTAGAISVVWFHLYVNDAIVAGDRFIDLAGTDYFVTNLAYMGYISGDCYLKCSNYDSVDSIQIQATATTHFQVTNL